MLVVAGCGGIAGDGGGISGYGDICIYFHCNLPDTITNYLFHCFSKLQVVCIRFAAEGLCFKIQNT
jgi:hypothetical protein